MSEKLKGEFQEACLAREMSESNVIRDLMTNFVRANKRQLGKLEEDAPATASKSAANKTKSKPKNNRKSV